MFDSATNSKKRGDIGLGAAIGWLVKNGWTVCVPIAKTTTLLSIWTASSGGYVCRVQSSIGASHSGKCARL